MGATTTATLMVARTTMTAKAGLPTIHHLRGEDPAKIRLETAMAAET